MNVFCKVICLVILIMVSSCSVKDVKRQMSIEWRLKKISIVADKNLNQGLPVAVDLLFIDEPSVVDSLSKLKAIEWFLDRKDYIRKYKNQLKTISYEIVPGQVIKNIDIPYSISADAVSIVIFADYFGEGSYNSVIKNKSEIIINLGPNDFEWSN